MTRRSKILLWVAGILAGLFIIFLVTIQFLAPVILNSESIKSRIETLASEEIGADITFRRIDLSLFPRFLIVVHQFGLSAPGTAEGTVEKVTAYPKLSHLLVGKFHIARAIIEAPDFAIVVAEGPEAKKKKKSEKKKKKTTFTQDMEAILGPIFGFLVPSPGMDVTINQCTLDLTEGTKPLFAFRNMDVRVVFPPSDAEKIPYQEILSARAVPAYHAVMTNQFVQAGSLFLPPAAQAASKDSSLWRFRVLMDMKNVDVRSRLLPGPVTITGGTVESLHEQLSFTKLRVGSSGTSLATSGRIGNYQSDIDAIDISADGTMARRFAQWILRLVGVAPEVKVQTALMFSTIHLIWDKNNFSFAGNVATDTGARIDADIRQRPGEIVVKKLILQDKKSRATLSLTMNKQIIDLSFSGNLTSGIIAQFMARKKYQNAWLKGDFQAHFLLDRPMQSTARGTLTGEHFVVPLGLKDPLIIRRISLQADKNVIDVLPTNLRWGKNHLSVNGTVKILKERFQIDMDVSSDEINWNEIQNKLASDTVDELSDHAGKQDDKQSEKGGDLQFQGTVRFKAASVTYDHYTIRPLHADIALTPARVRISIPKSLLCGVSTTGTVTLIQNDIQLDMISMANNQVLKPAIRCLSGEDMDITGTFNLSAHITSQGTNGDILHSLTGTISFDSTDGTIYRQTVLSQIISLLSITEVVRGKLPELGTEGFEYHTMKFEITLANGTLSIQESSIDGYAMDFFAQGDVDLVRKKLDLQIVVAPFGTANWVVGKIPVVNYILAGKLISIPIKVEGDTNDPNVTYLPASAVGSGLLGVVKRTLQVPVKIVEPVIPGDNEMGKEKED